MKSIIIIPARFGSSRFIGKPLALINNKSLLQRVWSIAKALNNIQEVYITTDDIRIAEHAREFDAEVIMTPSSCENGTIRVYEAAKSIKNLPDIIINLQGDAVLTPPWVIQALLDTMLKDQNIGLATLATKISTQQYNEMRNAKNNGAVGGTMVVFANNHDALYFSKSMIPFLRNINNENLPIYRHIGLYGYRYPTLQQYMALTPTPLEQLEGLEQLRALEHGIPIKVVEVDYRGRTHCAIDSPGDVAIVENIIAKEGELI
jgi:3-deoxy-manno-octulosonate cytidylyltransferase (CMP-KDO synthetase)